MRLEHPGKDPGTPRCAWIFVQRVSLAAGGSQARSPPQANSGSSKPTSAEGGLTPAAGPGPRDQDSRWKQYLEDERIALFLQNEEFMKELQRNRDFLLALERGGTPVGVQQPRLQG